MASTEHTPFRRLMASGSQLEREGRNEEAAVVFKEAARSVLHSGRIEACSAWKAAGINYRLAKQYDASEACFERALKPLCGSSEYPTERSLYWEIRRDSAMLRVDRSDYVAALKELEIVYENQAVSNDKLATGATLGFIARAQWLSGSVGLAHLTYPTADSILRGRHDIWELNNLIWWMRAASPLRRPSLAIRAVWLAFKTGHRRRAAEAVILLFGNRLYQRIKSSR